MEFLSVNRVRQLAEAKGFSCKKTGSLKGGLSLVTLIDSKGNVVEATRHPGHPLWVAADFLSSLPDPKPTKRRVALNGRR